MAPLHSPRQIGALFRGEYLGGFNQGGGNALRRSVGQFHLFDKLYGLEGVDPELVQATLDEMQLSRKTRFEDGRFTETNLSTGQRKRLALAVTLLENKEIMVFDEWAADQDPHFRAYFYEVVLKRLKDQGKTVLAVTHDERFWKHADRVIKMEYGSIVEDGRIA